MDLFKFIDEFKPEVAPITTHLKCFIPGYLPFVGDVDPMLKVYR